MTRERTFEKNVAIKATNDDERTATGVALQPNELDRQLDFFDADGIRAMFNPDPDDGVMHATFPSGDSELTRNEVLDAPETIDGHEFDAGAWVIQRHYTDDTRWQLVKSGTLGGFSIGGAVSAATEFGSVDALPSDVAVPDSVSPDAVSDKYHPPAKVTEGTVTEISDVDVPAVASATHAVVKGADSLSKNVLESTNGREEFVALMEQRGATEDGANALYDYMETANEKTAMGDSQLPDDATLGRRFKRFLLGGPSNSDEQADKQSPDTDMTETDNTDDDPTLAEQNAEAIEELTEKVDDAIDEASGDGGDGEAEAEADDASPTEAEKQAEQNAEAIEELTGKVDQIVEQGGGGSQQAGKTTPAATTKADVIEMENEVFTS